MNVTRQTIFVVDDDDSVRRALRRLLLVLGLNVETFATAEEFLQVRTPPEPGCLLLDVNLPGLSGLELQEQLKSEGRQVPLIFITAYADDRARDRSLQAGAIAFLEKPVEEQALRNAIGRALAQN
jgi:FixJ family two-component response regulator